MKETLRNEQYTYRVFVALLPLLMPSLALALDEAAARRTLGEASVSIGPWIAIAIAYFSRRLAIGGWLLCYYVQLYLGIILMVVLFATRYQDLAPMEWDSAMRYVMFLVSSIPLQVIRILELIVATQLLMRRTAEGLQKLRWVLVAMLIASAVAISIDAFFFPVAQKLGFDALALGFSIVWLIYFIRARRVRLVFIEHSWTNASSTTKRVLTVEDKKRLTVRTLIVSIPTFIVFLVMMGLSIGDTKPDAGIFFVPVFYTAIVALVAWYLPLRKRKGEGQAGSESKITPTP